jgi:hypothetical protein
VDVELGKHLDISSSCMPLAELQIDSTLFGWSKLNAAGSEMIRYLFRFFRLRLGTEKTNWTSSSSISVARPFSFSWMELRSSLQLLGIASIALSFTPGECSGAGRCGWRADRGTIRSTVLSEAIFTTGIVIEEPKGRKFPE